MLEHGPHRVHLGMAGATVAAGPVDLLKHRRCRLQPESRTTIILRYEHREKTGLGERIHELPGIGALPVQPLPIFSREIGAEPADRLADLGIALLIAAHDLPFSRTRSEEHTSELQSLMRISYAVFCLKKKKYTKHYNNNDTRERSTVRQKR